MLPNNHYSADKKWLEEQLSKLPVEIALEICGKYSAVYRDAYENEPKEVRKGGQARKAANTRLRLFVARYLAKSWK